MSKRIEDLLVTGNTRLNQRHFLLELKSDDALPDMFPGQFAEVPVNDSPATFLRRPFSIHEIIPASQLIRLLIQIKGPGTQKLSQLQPGDKLNTIYPLGNSFSDPPIGRVLLVGGGCGVAPLLFLAQSLSSKGVKPDILIGGRTSDDLLEVERYRQYGNVMLITEDGSEGEKGLVTDHSILNREQLEYRMIYCCGPDPMMKAVAKIAGIHAIPCEVSLENTMACGFGVCLCCVTPTTSGNQRVCVEGPVFNTKALLW